MTDGEGKKFEGEIRRSTPAGVTVCLVSEQTKVAAGGTLTLAQGLLKGDKMDFVVQKAAELGVDVLQPILSKRTVAGTPGASKQQRWGKIVHETIKQCGRTTRMKIAETIPLESFLEQERSTFRILFWEESKNNFRESFKKTPSTTILIGPEGGFPEEEVLRAQKKGCVISGLGSRILRAETAAIAAITLVQYETGQLED